MEEARTVLERAVAMDKTDKLAAENLRICMSSAKRLREKLRDRDCASE
jgi:hypothetical protein